MDDLSAWVGRSQRSTETVDARLVRWLAATLDRADLLDARDGATLPPAWHWAFFNAVEPISALGRDGHPRKGGFLPPTAQPRRMWAGSRLHWHGDLRVGQAVERASTILKCEAKRGRTGDMVLVTVGHQFRAGDALLLDEQHDIVYRDEASDLERRALAELAAQARAGGVHYERQGEIVREVTVGPVQMFRYSAVTFNGHRIHYDRDYARETEGYPGLVVHGPLIATMLLEFLQAQVAPGRRVERFEFRAIKPTFDIAPFALHAAAPAADGSVSLWSTNNVGAVGMQATATVR
ncbi:MAG: acyl-CoA dehydrogenase [Burkholderiales bacterium]|nr:MAG: acyl-CoA dehydrogenase [Burkholderiales bacterium]